METKFTKGEWRIYDMPLPSRKVIEIMGDGEVIASIKTKKGKYYSIKQVPAKYEANAKLIAAAPDMFNVLYAIHNMLDEKRQRGKRMSNLEWEIHLTS